ncbi:MAG TPA: ABC transporter permease [Prolixibacteraceae bacterium]|mgnify:CR=1 FL=1|nr:ABC transporter permease [Prolixibacteraceae bacterium]
MRTILYLIRKEFLQIFRDKFIGKAIFAVPVVQMLILVPAVTFEIRRVNLGIVNQDMSAESRTLVSQLEGSAFFKIRNTSFQEAEGRDWLHRGDCDLVVHIPADFGRELGKGNPVKIMVAANAINAVNAQLSWAYLNGVIRDYNQNRLSRQAGSPANISLQQNNVLNKSEIVYPKSEIPQILVTNRYWYNESLNYKYYMLPGILGILVLAIGFVLAGLNLVKEKESGTIEQINVTPVKKYHFILAKMFPFVVIGMIDIAIGLVIGKLVFGLPFAGNLGLLFLGSFIFMVAVLGLALFISTFSDTQQQFMFTAFFFMIIFILMSGIFTPIDSMPVWAQKLDMINPAVYVMRINRMVLLKGSTFNDISGDLLMLSVIAVAFTGLAVNRYRKTA